MSSLYSGGTLITRYVRLIKQVEPRKITDTLLDGSDFVQIIGAAPVRLEIELSCDLIGKNLIDEIDASGDLLTVFDKDNNEYSTRILTKADWKTAGSKYYQTTLTAGVVTE